MPFAQGAELFLGRQVPAANGARQAVMPRPYLQNKSRSLPSRQPLEPRALFAFLRREESEARRKNGHDSSVDESSLSSDTSCSSLEYHRPQSAGVELPRTSLRSSPVRSDEAKRPGAFPSSKGSTESLSRRERLQAAKARVEAQRSRYGGSSSEEDEDDGNKPTDVNKNRKRSRDVPAFTRLGPVWQESKAYQDPTMVRRGSPGVPLSVSTTFQGPTGPVQPSPQDSGVSSQSVASSPSLGRAPTPPPRRCQSRALLRESPLLAPKPRRHSASFELCRLDDSGFGSERRESFNNYGGMPPAHEVKPRARGPAYYSYTDQAPVHQDSSGAYMSDPQRPDGRFVGLAPRHRRASISAEVLDLAPKSDMPPRRPRPLSMVMEKTRDVPPPVPRHKPQMGGTTNSLEVARRRLDDVMQRERERRSSANLETALNELEEIYQSLRLNEDEDLLFRAERRDLPTKFQLSRPDSNTTFVEPTYPLKRSCSDDISAMSGHQPRQRAPSFRRSAVPDKLTDDLAYRRLVQQPQPPHRNGARTPTPRKDASYLLYSPAFTPSLQVDPALLDFTLSKEPDIEKDDMSYRNYTQADAIRVPAPQPPFGIPLLPTQGTSCDYLRARPSDAQRPLTRPKVHPDLVRDDMAFRNLRKDPAVSLASRRPTLFVNINSDPSEKRDKSQSMTSVMEALHRESQRWKRLDESVQSPQSGPSSASSLRSSGPNWGLARQRGRIVPMEDSQLDSLLASLTPPPVGPATDDVAEGMSAKAGGPPSFARAVMDTAETDSHKERVERYKKQRREELARKYSARATAEANGTQAAGAPKSKAVLTRTAEAEKHASETSRACEEPTPSEKSATGEKPCDRRGLPPSVRMTKAYHLRLLSNAATNAHNALDPTQHNAKPEAPHRGERHGLLRPLDLNENVPLKLRSNTASGRSENNPSGSSRAAADKPPRRRAAAAASRPSDASLFSSSVSDKPRQLEPLNSLSASSLVPTESQSAIATDSSHNLQPCEAEELKIPQPTESSSFAEAASHCQVLNTEANVGVHPQHQPRVFSVTYHTTSTSFLEPSNRLASSPEASLGAEHPRPIASPCDEASEDARDDERAEEPRSCRRASLSDAVHGILKANSRDEDASVGGDRRPRHSILKNKSSSSEERDHSPELHSILKSKPEDVAKPPPVGGPKPILKRHDDAGGAPSEPKPILKRKSVDEDGEERPKPILKPQPQGRRWSHEHAHEGAVVVRRRSHSIELESRPVLAVVRVPTNDAGGEVGEGGAPSSPVTFLRRGRSASEPRVITGWSPDYAARWAPVNVTLGGEDSAAGASEECGAGDSTVEPKLLGAVGSSVDSAAQLKKYHRRNASCYKTQPVTASEIKASDSLESVRSFRTLVSKEASLSVFSKEESDSKPEPKAEPKPEPKPDRLPVVKRLEFPQTNSPDRRPTREDRLRRRTLPITAEEIMDATKRSNGSKPAAATADEGGDDPSELSVAAKVSLFKRTVDPSLNVPGKRPPKPTSAERRSLPRFRTQPVTTGELRKAAGGAEDEEEDSKEDALSKMSLADKLKMFNQTVSLDVLRQRPPVRSSSMRRAMPDKQEAESTSSQATLGLPLTRARSHSSPPEDCCPAPLATAAAAPKSILKPQAGQQPVVKGILKQDGPETKEDIRGILKPEQNPEQTQAAAVKPILKPEHKSTEEEEEEDETSSSEDSSSEEAKPAAEEDSSTSSSGEEESEEEGEEDDTKRILLGGQRHLVISEGSSPMASRKLISNPAIQRRINASLRRKEEEERRSTHEVLASESRLRSYSAPSEDGLDEMGQRRLYLRDTNRTQPITQGERSSCGGGIAQRLAALRKSGEDWQKRVDKEDVSKPQVAVIPVSELRKDVIIEVQKSASIGDRKSWLETSSESWRQRVPESDASQFTVAGKMGCLEPVPTLVDRKRRTPKQETFSAATKAELRKRIQEQGTAVLPSIFRSKSMPNAAEELSRLKMEEARPIALIPREDNETFTSFFESVLPPSRDKVDISEASFDDVICDNVKLGQRRQVSVRRKKQTRGNPLKALASRTDLHAEYVEVRTNIAEEELKRINIEKLAQNSDLALSALAGLASTEDFRRVQLKKSEDTGSLLPNRELILIQVKGRRHVQTRLVEPSVSSLNHGDVFVLVTPSDVYCWIGKHSNIIERTKATDVAQSIQSKKDLLFKGSSEVKFIDEDKGDNSADSQAFFKLLGGSPDGCSPAGDPGEDLRFEAAIVDTNMVYTVEGEALVPCDKYWGMQPRVDMLQPDKAYVFNFGSEVYVWLGKQVPSQLRSLAVRLAEEQCKAGFDYSECDINPLFPRMGPKTEEAGMSSDVRPNWALFAKVNQHMEPVLFREKFLDWPDDAKLIRVKTQEQEDRKTDSWDSGLRPCNAKELLARDPVEPDLELSGSHLGRGLEYYDSLERRQYTISTLGLRVWHITEYEHRALPESSYGQFHSGDTYVVRWLYTVTQTGRDLSGQRSRHAGTGRERCAYFFWQGRDSTVTEQGACALLTIELDEERGPHVRVLQGKEPPCFLNLFKGRMVVYKGKREEESKCSGAWRMFVVRGEAPSEAALVETRLGVENLRTRGSFLVLGTGCGKLYLWHGAQCCRHARRVATHAARAIVQRTPAEMGLSAGTELQLVEVNEGSEVCEFWDGLGGDKKKKQHLFVSLLDSPLDFRFTPRLFHATLVSGTFEACEVSCPFQRVDVPCAYPFLQSDLYNAPQPAVFFLDNRHEVYVWQGWWPQKESDAGSCTPNSSEKVRWNTTRRLAMETALHYSQEMSSSDPPKVYLVFAGLEPVQFTSLFPEWEDRDDIACINMKEGRTHGDCLSVQETLSQLTQTHYPLEELKADPLPEGVDPQRLESYLTDEEFEAVFECSKAKFYELPSWTQNKRKKQAGLF